MPKKSHGLFNVLEAHLKAATEPLTCVELYDLPDVRKHAESANRVIRTLSIRSR